MITHRIIYLLLIVLPVSVFGQHSFYVDFNQTIGPIKDLTSVNKGDTNLYGGYREANISSVRMHDYHGANDYCFYSDFWNYNNTTKLYSSINNSFDPNNPDHYHWSDFDSVVQEIIDFNLSPYIRLGSSYPNPHYQLQPLEPPLDSDGINFTKFAKLCKRTIMHTNEGWDNGTHHNIKYWEIWNEPGGLFWKGEPIQFYKMFKTVMDTLKSSFPALKFGGPGAHPSTALEVSAEYGTKFLNYLKNNGVALDFYSWHIYGIKNPYSLSTLGNYWRTKLDERGFSDTESHITEINHALTEKEFSYFDHDAKGAAYYSSLLITAQNSYVDKLFWYPGKALFEDDGYSYSWPGYGLKSYNLILKETPTQIFSSGDLVIDNNRTVDTTNIMLLAAKYDDEKVYLLLSNYNSNESNFNISLNNLPWKNSDSIRVVQNITKNPEIKFAETAYYISGSDSLNLRLMNMPAPSIALIRLEKGNSTFIKRESPNQPFNFKLEQNYPNPFNPTTAISYQLSAVSQVQLIVYNPLGQKVRTLVNRRQEVGSYSVIFDAAGLASGVYFYYLATDKGFVQTKKMLLLR